MREQQIAPCPWCPASACKVSVIHLATPPWKQVVTECEARGPAANSVRFAIESWNKIAAPSPAADPAPVRDAAESAQIVRVDDCLASVLASAECDCIPNEFQCVKHGAMDEVRALRARVAGLEAERDEFRNRAVAFKDERDAARALLAVERETIKGLRAALMDADLMEAHARVTHDCCGACRDYADRYATRLRALARAQEGRGT